MSAETPQNVSNSLIAKSVNAIPFVPSNASISTFQTNKGLQSINSAELVKAAPFVPGTLKPSPPEPANGTKVNKLVNAAPFVPKSKQGAEEGGALLASQSEPQPHGGGRGGLVSGRGHTQPRRAPQNDGSSRDGVPAGWYGQGSGVPTNGGSAGRGRGAGPSSAAGRGVGSLNNANVTVHNPYDSSLASTSMGGSHVPYSNQNLFSDHFRADYSYGNTRGTSRNNQRSYDVSTMGSGRIQTASQFMSEGLRQQLQLNSYLVQAQWSPEQIGRSPEDDSVVVVPGHIGIYHTIYPLEAIPVDGNDRVSAAFGLRTSVFKSISSQDGRAYALRKICGKQVIPNAELLSRARSSVDAWTAVSEHPNMVGLRAAFVSSDMDGGTPALFFVHDYHPGSLTLTQAHMLPSSSSSGVTSLRQASEAQLWSYLVQLTSVLRCVHNAGLRLRPQSLHPTKVLLTPFGRIRVNGVGVADTLSPFLGDPNDQDDVQLMHRLELTAVGQLILTLACAGLSSTPQLDVCAAHHSMELTRTLAALLASADGGGLSSWRQLAAALADHTLEEMDGLGGMTHELMGELEKEFENGRLMRLMVKLGFVNERPELDGDTQWSETGDRYLLKLFRDFVFHQYSEEGSALTDWGHVTEALNKLDAGVPEKILLMSRDEQSMLVVSYSDLKACVEMAYAQVRDSAKKRSI